MPRPIAIVATCLLLFAVTITLALPSFAAPLAQALLPNFIMRAQTTISVTVVLADGNSVLVPIGLDFTTRHEAVGGYLTLDTTVAQQPNMLIAVEESKTISASMAAIVYTTPQPAQPVVIVPPTLPAPLPTVATIVVVPPTPLPTPLPPVVATPVPQPTPTNAIATGGDTYRIGQDVMTGNIKWRVISSDDLGNTLVSDNQFIDDATTGGRFIRVVVEIDNRGSDPAAYWAPEMLDSQERTFNEFSGQYSFIPDGFACIFLTVNPGLSKQCTHIYEVAGDAQGLKLKVTDFGLFFGNEAFIQLQ